MDVTHYKIWDWGKKTGDGKCVQYNVGIATKAKRSETNPYALANEVLCLRLGIALNLPVPLGAVIEKDGKLYYASLHVAVADEGLPPASDEDLKDISADERLACGIVMFDSWILNEDRGPQNISYIDGRTFIFDHEAAFLDRHGTSYLTSQRDKICIGNHCLASHVKSLSSFDEWHTKMLAIPDYYINDSVKIASEATVAPVQLDIDFCTNFLINRRWRLREIFRLQRHEVFPNLDEGLLDPFAGNSIEYQI